MACLGAYERVLLAFGQYVEEILINMVVRGSKITLAVLVVPNDTLNNM